MEGQQFVTKLTDGSDDSSDDQKLSVQHEQNEMVSIFHLRM